MAVTLSKYGSSINRLLCHLVGLSTDTKPISTYTDKSGKVFLLENGSSFEEMDTDKKYLYDAENQTWNLAASGGGGGGSATLIEKSITENGEYNASADNADGYSKVTVNVAGGGGETFEVEITISGTVSDTNRTFTTSKTIQETIDAIKARKQIDFSATWNGREGEVICYGVYNMGVGEAILMIVFDSTSVYPIYWMGDEDVWSRNQTPFMIAGIQT